MDAVIVFVVLSLNIQKKCLSLVPLLKPLKMESCYIIILLEKLK
tara:strand:- start:40624 stop:40755 length:132 start_codon:yes stop_codon:yes gene_type:complete